MNYNRMSSQTEADIENITRLVNIEKKSILELGCGDGRITFAIAEKVRELIAIDIDAKMIEEAQKKNKCGNVTFLIENIEDFHLGRNFEVILSIGVGYMYLKDISGAIGSIFNHLEEDGVFLLICSSPVDEYQRIVNLLVKENVRTTSFYSEFEKILSKHFTFEKRMLERQLTFSNFEEITICFERELREEYQTEIKEDHKQELKKYFNLKDSLSVGVDSQAYLCRK